MTSDWKEYKLKDVCIKITDGVHNTVKDDIQGECYLLSCKNLKNNQIVISPQDRKISFETLQRLRQRTETQKGDVLLSSVGTIGETAIIKEFNPNYEFQRSVAILKPNTSMITSEYLFYFLNNSKRKLQHSAEGAVQQCLFINPLKEFKIDIPPLKTQQKIAKVLSAIDDKIELNNSINNNLEQQIFTIFDNKFPNVRDGENTISDYFSLKRGKNLLSKNAILGDVPVIAGGLNPATYHNVANTKAPVITISASGANAGFVNLWHIPVWSSDSSYIDNTITSNIYFWYVMLKKRQQEIFDSQTGSAQPHIYPQHIEGMTVSDIDMNLVNDFNDNVTPLFINIGENIKENQKLIQLRDTLLPKLMSGEIDVSNVDISTDKLLFSEEKYVNE